MLPDLESKLADPADAAAAQAGPLDAVRAGLSLAGFSPLQILALIPIIVRLLREYGPQIAEIVETLRKLFKGEADPKVIG